VPKILQPPNITRNRQECPTGETSQNRERNWETHEIHNQYDSLGSDWTYWI